MFDDYEKAFSLFKNKHTNTLGVVDIVPDEFGVDIIVVLIDDLRFKNVDVPASFNGYDVQKIGAYSSLEAYRSIVNTYIINDPSVWKVENKIPFNNSVSKLEKLILDYENNINNNIENSLLKIRDTMRWINIHKPLPKKAK